jgi:carbon-monoxide dehydrogenase large subunit
MPEPQQEMSQLSDHPYKGRREDLRLVTGRGRYTADHDMAGQACAHFLRADRAHARIVSIDTTGAKKLPGVLDVVTGEDIVATGWKSPAPLAFFKGVGGSSLRDPFRPALAHGRVRFVGEPVALIIAETEHVAQDAAELIAIDYEDLPVIVDAADGLAAQAIRLHDSLPDNLAFEYEYGNRDAAARGFEGAAHVVRVAVSAQRIAGNPMEPKSCVARYDAAQDLYEICAPSQGTSDLRNTLAQVTGLDRGKFRIHSNDVGGGFGIRNEVYPEFVALMLAAKRVGRPVKWTGTRSETISGDHHGRAADLSGELALDRDGRFLALRVEWLVNLGAYCSSAGPLINTVAAPTSSASSLYNVPALYGRHRLVFTNTTPTTAYRGAGRPNVGYLWERLVEEAATKLGIDSIELRRRNLLAKSAFPHKTLTGHTYDSADPAGLLEGALKESRWSSFATRRQEAKDKGRLRGIGLALFLEPSGGVGKEEIKIEVGPDGRLGLLSNAGPSGQGHETVFPALVADILGLPEDRIELRYNEVAMPRLAGTGSFGSRSLICHGAGLAAGAREIVRKGRELAAKELEVAAQDVTFDNGRYRVTGTDLAIDLQTIIAKHLGNGEHPLDTGLAIDTASAFPSGAHVAEVEIDPETGTVEIVSYVAVDDCGTIYNHTIVEGQLVGGLMQGIGQALGEHIVYDRESGQLLSGTFMDYFMPRADILPLLALHDRGVPSPANALGAKGAGEAGATGSIPALANAVHDALKPLDIHHVEMPYTPGRIWRAIHQQGD